MNLHYDVCLCRQFDSQACRQAISTLPGNPNSDKIRSSRSCAAKIDVSRLRIIGIQLGWNRRCVFENQYVMNNVPVAWNYFYFSNELLRKEIAWNHEAPVDIKCCIHIVSWNGADQIRRSDGRLRRINRWSRG